MNFQELRRNLHSTLVSELIREKQPTKRGKKKAYPNFADGTNNNSILIAQGIAKRLSDQAIQPDFPSTEESEEAIGTKFQNIVKIYLQESFELLQHIRPGEWSYQTTGAISEYFQYDHLNQFKGIISDIDTLPPDVALIVKNVIGRDYLVKPDITIGRAPVSDEHINSESSSEAISDSDTSLAGLTPLRKVNNPNQKNILHASISCKWTLRSDRAQNVRTEALNLIRYRRGPLPHVMAVIMEPLPSRIKSLALTDGDLDCVYHIALHELRQALGDIDSNSARDQAEDLEEMISRKKLRDISDLPFDLAI